MPKGDHNKWADLGEVGWQELPKKKRKCLRCDKNIFTDKTQRLCLRCRRFINEEGVDDPWIYVQTSYID